MRSLTKAMTTLTQSLKFRNKSRSSDQHLLLSTLDSSLPTSPLSCGHCFSPSNDLLRDKRNNLTIMNSKDGDIWRQLNAVDYAVVRDVESKGRGLVAGKNVKEGDIIMVLAPPVMMAIHQADLPTTCYCCLKQGTTLKSCGKCGVTRFCDRSCQTKAWKLFHKYECQALVQLRGPGGQDPPANVGAPLRLVLLHDAGKVSKATFDQVKSLYVARNLPPRVQRAFEACGKFIANITKTKVPPQTISDLLNIVRSNTFEHRTSTGHVIGTAVFLKLSMANHSCQENAETSSLRGVTWDCISSFHMTECGPQPYAALKAKTNIAIGEEITSNYLSSADRALPRKDRVALLRERWGFDCHCVRCLAEDATATRED